MKISMYLHNYLVQNEQKINELIIMEKRKLNEIEATLINNPEITGGWFTGAKNNFVHFINEKEVKFSEDGTNLTLYQIKRKGFDLIVWIAERIKNPTNLDEYRLLEAKYKSQK